MNKKILLTIAAVSIVGAGLLTSTTVFAQNTAEGQNPMTSLATKIADKFGLKKEDVQAVFDAERQERQKEMETRYEDELSQAVKDGKLTENQKSLIIAKQKELNSNRQTTMENMKNKTGDERKAAMKKERTDLETWAKENGIDIKYMRGGFGMSHKGPGGPGPNGENNPPSAIPTTNQ